MGQIVQAFFISLMIVICLQWSLGEGNVDLVSVITLQNSPQNFEDQIAEETSTIHNISYAQLPKRMIGNSAKDIHDIARYLSKLARLSRPYYDGSRGLDIEPSQTPDVIAMGAHKDQSFVTREGSEYLTFVSKLPTLDETKRMQYFKMINPRRRKKETDLTSSNFYGKSHFENIAADNSETKLPRFAGSLTSRSDEPPFERSKKPRGFEYSEFTSYSSNDHKYSKPSSSKQSPPNTPQYNYREPNEYDSYELLEPTQETSDFRANHQNYIPYLQPAPNHSSPLYGVTEFQSPSLGSFSTKNGNLGFKAPDKLDSFTADNSFTPRHVTVGTSHRGYNSLLVDTIRPDRVKKRIRIYIRPQTARPAPIHDDTLSSAFTREYEALPRVPTSQQRDEYKYFPLGVTPPERDFQREHGSPATSQEFNIQEDQKRVVPVANYGYRYPTEYHSKPVREEIKHQQTQQPVPTEPDAIYQYQQDHEYVFDRPIKQLFSRNIDFQKSPRTGFNFQQPDTHSETSESLHNPEASKNGRTFQPQPQSTNYNKDFKKSTTPLVKPNSNISPPKSEIQKGCKTVVKEIHQVPKKGEELSSQPNTVIKTKVCFFPGDDSDEPSQLEDVHTEFYEPFQFSFEGEPLGRRPNHETNSYQSTSLRPRYRTKHGGYPFSFDLGNENRYEYRFQKPDSNSGDAPYFYDDYQNFHNQFSTDSSYGSSRMIPSQDSETQVTASTILNERPFNHHDRPLNNYERHRDYGIRDESFIDGGGRRGRKPKNYNKSFSFYRRHNKHNNPNNYSEEYFREKFNTFSTNYDSRKDRFQ